MKTILGIFSDKEYAERAVNRLEEEGFRPQDISIVMKDHGDAEHVTQNTGVDVTSGAATGIATGAVIGGIAGLLIGVGAIAIPGIGGLLVAGPLAAAFGLTGAAATTASGAVTGAVAGGILGALVSLGLPEEDARVYESRIREGGILVAVPTSVRGEEVVRDILSDEGAEQIRTVGSTARADEEDVPSYEQLPRARYTQPGYFAGAKGGRRSTAEPDDEYADALGDEEGSSYEEPTLETSEDKTQPRGWFEKPRARRKTSKRKSS